jgi:hypothetical protein
MRMRTIMHSNYINIKSTLYDYLIATHAVPQKLHTEKQIHQISTLYSWM